MKMEGNKGIIHTGKKETMIYIVVLPLAFMYYTFSFLSDCVEK
jgi:hypothetical protein